MGSRRTHEASASGLPNSESAAACVRAPLARIASGVTPQNPETPLGPLVGVDSRIIGISDRNRLHLTPLGLATR
jgi:hypothetical protein